MARRSSKVGKAPKAHKVVTKALRVRWVLKVPRVQSVHKAAKVHKVRSVPKVVAKGRRVRLVLEVAGKGLQASRGPKACNIQQDRRSSRIHRDSRSAVHRANSGSCRQCGDRWVFRDHEDHKAFNDLAGTAGTCSVPTHLSKSRACSQEVIPCKSASPRMYPFVGVDLDAPIAGLVCNRCASYVDPPHDTGNIGLTMGKYNV